MKIQVTYTSGRSRRSATDRIMFTPYPSKSGKEQGNNGNTAFNFEIFHAKSKTHRIYHDSIIHIFNVITVNLGECHSILRGVPRISGGVPRVLWGVPRVLGGVPRVLGGIPRDLGGIPRDLGGVPRVLGNRHVKMNFNFSIIHPNFSIIHPNLSKMNFNFSIIHPNLSIIHTGKINSYTYNLKCD